MGTLTKLVEERSDITEEDLLTFFEKQSELHSPVWLLIVGLILGGGGLTLYQLLKDAGTTSSSLTGIWLQAYFVMFIVLLLLIPMGVGVFVVYIVKYNPFNVQEMLMRDYLEAKKRLQEKSKPIKNKSLASVNAQEKREPDAEPGEDDSKSKGEFLIVQYRRLADDVRAFEGILWQIPSFSFTIATALVVGALQFLPSHSIPRFGVLLLASFFLFIMSQVTIKDRFAIGWRLAFLQEIERSWGAPTVPAGTREQLDFLRRTHEVFIRVKGKLTPESVIKLPSHLLLAALLFLVALSILALAIYSILMPP